MRKGHLIESIMEDQMQQKEDERNARMDIIGQNGNDGEHYEDEHELKGSFDVGKSGEVLTADEVYGAMRWTQPDTYVLDTSEIYSIDDIVKVLECMNVQIQTFCGDIAPFQQELINKGIFKKQ